MWQTGTDVGQSWYNFLFKGSTLLSEVMKGELFETLLRNILRAQHVEELVGNPWLTKQAINVKAGEVIKAQGSLNLVINFVDDPRDNSCDFILDDFFGLVVNFEIHSHLFSFGRIIINLLLDESVDVFTIDSENKCVLRHRLIVNSHLCQWI